MTALLRIITPNDADAATITAAPAMVPTLPQTNLRDQARERVARTTSTAAQDIKLAWSSARVFSGAALMRHNLTSSALWRWRFYGDSAWTNLYYDSGNVVAVPPKALGDIEWGVDPLGASLFTGWALAFSVLWFAPVVAQSAILTLTDPDNPDGYLEASRLHLGRYLEAAYNHEYGLGLSWRENTTLERTDGGTLRSDGSDPYRRMRFRLAWLSPTDRPKFMEWARRDGLRNDAFISPYAEDGTALERDHSMSAKLVDSPEMVHVRANRFSADYIVEEA